MIAPKYDIGNVAYIKESAALGFLEPVQIASVQQYNGSWVYTIQAQISQPQNPSLYGDRTSIISGAVLYFSEGELISQCDALALAEAKAQQNLEAIQAKRSKNCT